MADLFSLSDKEILYSYINGNSKVTIYSDGTKIREYDGELKAHYPESFDCKITNKCDGNCAYCHEKSTPDGKHADLNRLLSVLKDIPAGTECAVGGGSPLSHPDILPFLIQLKQRGIISNITINQKHLNKHQDLLIKLINDKLIYGLGISYNNPIWLNDIKPLLPLTDNIVFHLIMGVNTLKDVDALIDLCTEQNKSCKILVLGYKNYGNGAIYCKNHNIEDNKYQWFTQLATYFHKEQKYPSVFSFDNLAIEQLKLRRYFTDSAWNKFYMGNDGSATMYIDAVEQKFAKSSTSDNRVSFDDMDLISYFHSLRT